MAVSWQKYNDYGSCSVHKTGCLRNPSLVLESQGVPREQSSIYLKIPKKQILIPADNVLVAGKVNVSARVWERNQNWNPLSSKHFYVCCHQKLWPYYGSSHLKWSNHKMSHGLVCLGLKLIKDVVKLTKRSAITVTFSLFSPVAYDLLIMQTMFGSTSKVSIVFRIVSANNPWLWHLNCKLRFTFTSSWNGPSEPPCNLQSCHTLSNMCCSLELWYKAPQPPHYISVVPSKQASYEKLFSWAPF